MPTQEEIEKFAEEIRAAKQQGFIAQMVGRGKSASEVKTLHSRYVELDNKREAKFEGIRSAILGSE